ncbi:MAG: HlyD family efflux transporter periplasmic adaptor subunit [Phycisphaerae bacterium]|jgi:multidrug resistance efflux pump|nr:HlyD family efflux transporter periplasmic adaptor subunit [Phycisphaerae bacterium]
MSALPRIKTPWLQHLRRIRYQLLPVVTFTVAVILTGWLWGRHVIQPNAVGEVYAERFDLISHEDGILASLSFGNLEIMDEIEAGQVVARIDDRSPVASLDAMQSELKGLRDQLKAAAATFRQDEAERSHDILVQQRRLALDVERIRLEILDRQGQVAADRIEQKRLDERITTVQKLVEKRLQSVYDLMDFTLQRDVVKERIAGNEEFLKEARSQLAATKERLGAYSVVEPAGVETVVAPIRSEIAAQEARVRELQIQVSALQLRSPISGKVSAIYRLPGNAVRAGDVIMTVAADHSQRIISYLREGQRFRPEVGMEVTIRTRSEKPRMVKAMIEQIGPQFEAIPEHQLRHRDLVEWGLPVSISLPEGVGLIPGELVDITFPRRAKTS